MNLEKIVWPVFRLGEKTPQTEDGVTYYATEYEDLDTNEHSAVMRIVDDKSINKETLSRRRLQLLVEGVKLFPINKAVYFLGDLLKLAKNTTWFIDSHGMVFQYKKTRRVKLLVREITKVLPTNGLGAVIELKNIPQRFKTAFKPNDDDTYAAVLYSNHCYILYGLYKDKPKESWRLI